MPSRPSLPKPKRRDQGWFSRLRPDKLPPKRADGSEWPRISIVTATLNQGRYIEDTIRSVLLQGYPNLEFFVADGGSTDETPAVLYKYRHFINEIIPNKRHGQTEGIHLGLTRCTGELFNWLNSDDYLEPGALREIGECYRKGESVAGGCIDFFPDGSEVEIHCRALSAANLIHGLNKVVYHQPAFWWDRKAFHASGGIDERFDYVFDWELAIRYLQQFPKVNYTSKVLARFRHHAESKTANVGDRFPEERIRAIQKILLDPDYESLHGHCRYRLELERWWQVLPKLTEKKNTSSVSKAIQILQASLEQPRVRWSRMTLGAISRCLREGLELRAGDSDA